MISKMNVRAAMTLLVVVMAMTAQTVWAENITWDEETKTLTVRSLESASKEGHDDVVTLIIGSDVDCIGMHGFAGCSKLKTVIFEDGSTLRSIDVDAFGGCESLTDITIPANVTTIGQSAFQGCKSLTEITIPEGVTSIGESAFQDCTALATVTFKDRSKLENILNNTFYHCTALTAITIPSGVRSIGESAFFGCIKVTSDIIIPSSVTSIGKNAFNNVSSFKSNNINISAAEGSHLQSIGTHAFANAFASIDLSACTEFYAITDNIFDNVKRDVILPSSLTSISQNAFKDFGGDHVYVVVERERVLQVTIEGETYPEYIVSQDGMVDIDYCLFIGSNRKTSRALSLSLIIMLGEHTVTTSAVGGGTVLVTKTPENDESWTNELVVNEGETVYFKFLSNNGYLMSYSIETEYGDGVTATGNSFTMPAADVTVSAIFKENGQASIIYCTLHNDGHGTASADKTGQLTPGTLVTLTATPNEGYKFNVWQVESGGNGLNLDITKSTVSFYMPDHTVELKAMFRKLLDFTVAFDANSGLGTMNSVTVREESQYTVPECTFTNGDQIFAGWATSADGPVEYLPGNTITMEDNMTLYAKWSSPSGSCGENVTWSITNLEGGGMLLTISGTGAMTEFSNNKDRPWNDLSKSIKTVTIESGVTSIGNYAFFECTSLTAISIPASVTTIGIHGFEYCSSLTAITIPASVTSIGIFIFRGCSALATVTFEEGSKFTTIGNYSFKDCSSLTAITIPASVTSLAYQAFYGCSALATVTFEAGSMLTSIDDNAFERCTSLTAITFPASMSTIGDRTFRGCSALATVTFEAGSKLTSIDNSAFSGCTSLTAISIPASVTSIGQVAFENCSALATVIFEEGSKLTSISGSLFIGCTSLKAISIPVSVTSIGSGAFATCPSLTDITIPASVESIGNGAFNGCSALATVYVLPTTPPTLGANVRIFNNCSSLESIYVPASALNDYKGAKGWKYYASIIMPEEGPAIATVTTEGGETIEYSSVEKAFEAAQNQDVVTLLADYNVPVDQQNGKDGILYVGNIYEQVCLTLDLNGHTLGFPKGGFLNVRSLTDLTISGGTISGTATCINNTGTLRLGDCTITATEGIGITGNGDLELHALPTFNCKNEDIALAKDQVIYFATGSYTLPEKKIKVSITNDAPYRFTYNYRNMKTAEGELFNPEDVFISSLYGEGLVGTFEYNGWYEAGIAGLTEITFPAGKSTYYDDRALALYEANDHLKFYTATGMENNIVEMTEIAGKKFSGSTPLIVSNETDEKITAQFIEALVGPMENSYYAAREADLEEKEIYPSFYGTNEDLEEAVDIEQQDPEQQDPEKNYFYPINGLTYYEFNGTGFVRMNSYGPIDAHRCWLAWGEPLFEEPEEPNWPIGPSKLAIRWPDGTITGKDADSAEDIVEMVKAIAGQSDNALDMNGDGVVNIADIIMAVNGLNK